MTPLETQPVIMLSLLVLGIIEANMRRGMNELEARIDNYTSLATRSIENHDLGTSRVVFYIRN